MKYQVVRCNSAHNFRIRQNTNGINSGAPYVHLDIPDELYEEIKNKLHGKPYTGIHKEIFELIHPKRGILLPSEVILDYMYNNGFDYMFEE